jgi:DegV family protein with EDD domain
LPTANPLPTTSQATPGDFLTPFEKYTAAGDEVIALVISSKLSGTYDSAVQAVASLPDQPIDIVDSRSVSVGLGLLLQEGVRLAEAGATRSQIVARLTELREQVRILFVLETLEYLQRGGRIGKAQAFVGTLLKFKPILGIVDGEVAPVTRVRSRQRALATMEELLLNQVSGRGAGVRLALTHACAPTDAQVVAHALADRFNAGRVFTSDLGPVLGTHVGPGTIGAAALLVA